MAFGFGRGQQAMDTGPSPSLLTRLAGGLNNAAQNYGDPNSQRIAGQTGQVGQVGQMRKKRQGNAGVPVNGPGGMKPASSIMQTGNAAPNPYDMGGGGSNTVQGPSTMPISPIRPPVIMPGMQPGGMMGAPGMGMPPTGMPQGGNPQFWNMYNQNRPPQMMG